MFSVNRNDGYPERHHQVVRTTTRRCLACTAATFLIAVAAVASTLYSRLPPVCTAFAVVMFLLFGLITSIGAMIDVRTVRVIPYFTRTVGGIDTFLSGESIARNLRRLDELAERGGFTPLSHYGFHDDLMGEELHWHSAADGIQTVDALLNRLSKEPTTVDDLESVLNNLRKLRHALDRAHAQDIGFCLLIRHGNTTSGHEWSLRRGTAF